MAPSSELGKAIGKTYFQTLHMLYELGSVKIRDAQMKNTEIARVFEDIAEMLKLKKDNIFKIRAYQKAAHSIAELTVAAEQLVREDRLKEIPGVGEAITNKITELVTTGHLAFYERLKAELSEETK